MPNVTPSVPPELAKKMRKHPEVRWSEVARQAITDHLEFLDLLNKATDPSIKEEEFAKLAVKIQHKRRKPLWSNDAHFKKQNKIRTYNTEELR